MQQGDWIDCYMDLFCGRLSDHSVQLETGLYARTGLPLDRERVIAHLRGEVSLATYVIDELGDCRFAVFDADDEDTGFSTLVAVQASLWSGGIPSWLECSRRGGHLWVFLDRPVSAALLRAWLLPFCPAGFEFYPKQDQTAGVGSAIRLPFGIHRLSGRRYPFVSCFEDGQWDTLGAQASDQVSFLFSQSRAIVPCWPVVAAETCGPEREQTAGETQKKPLSMHTSVYAQPAGAYRTIAEWNAAQDPFAVIGRYVDLDHNGGGRCPFGEHHANGHDDYSFKVYVPRRPGGSCWYCYAWQAGGSVFDFLKLYHNLSASELWQRIQRGEL